MAFSSTKKTEQLLGALKVQIYDVNFDAVTSGHVKTGLNNVYAAVFVDEVTEEAGLVKTNKDSTGAAAEFGGVHVSGVTASDTGKLIVIGA